MLFCAWPVGGGQCFLGSMHEDDRMRDDVFGVGTRNVHASYANIVGARHVPTHTETE